MYLYVMREGSYTVSAVFFLDFLRGEEAEEEAEGLFRGMGGFEERGFRERRGS